MKCKCGHTCEPCKGVYPFSVDYWICPECDSTYSISSREVKLQELRAKSLGNLQILKDKMKAYE